VHYKSTVNLQVSYPFQKEPYQLEWHPVNKRQINTIRIWVSDGRDKILDVNGLAVAVSIMIEEQLKLFCKYIRMNHPSEWTKFYDEHTGRYRYKHKRSGLVRDTLMTIGKVFKAGIKNVGEKAAQVTTEKVGQNVGEMVVEKGADKIQQILRKRSPEDTEKKLQKILQNRVSKDALYQRTLCRKMLSQTKSNFRNSNLISPSNKLFFIFIYRLFRSIATMFRSLQYLEKTEYIQITLDTPLTFAGNNQTQRKSGHKFTARDRDNCYDWYNAYFRINFTFEGPENGARTGANTESAPINGSFSLIIKYDCQVGRIVCLRGEVIFLKKSARLQ